MATDDELDDARVLASIGRIIGAGNLLPLVDSVTKLPPAPTTTAIREGLAELDEDGRIADAAVPERLDEETLNGTFVRFVDHVTGEPIDPAGTVVIKVNVATGDIDDIVFEEV